MRKPNGMLRRSPSRQYLWPIQDKWGWRSRIQRLYGLRGIRFANPANSRDNRGEFFSFLACSAAKTSRTTIPGTEFWDLRLGWGREWGVLKTPDGRGWRSPRLTPIRLRASILNPPWLPLEPGGKAAGELECPDGMNQDS